MQVVFKKIFESISQNQNEIFQLQIFDTALGADGDPEEKLLREHPNVAHYGWV